MLSAHLSINWACEPQVRWANRRLKLGATVEVMGIPSINRLSHRNKWAWAQIISHGAFFLSLWLYTMATLEKIKRSYTFESLFCSCIACKRLNLDRDSFFAKKGKLRTQTIPVVRESPLIHQVHVASERFRGWFKDHFRVEGPLTHSIAPYPVI